VSAPGGKLPGASGPCAPDPRDDAAVPDEEVATEDVADGRIHGEDMTTSEQNALRHDLPFGSGKRQRPGRLNFYRDNCRAILTTLVPSGQEHP
jgi:hypothetical protein